MQANQEDGIQMLEKHPGTLVCGPLKEQKSWDLDHVFVNLYRTKYSQILECRSHDKLCTGHLAQCL